MSKDFSELIKEAKEQEARSDIWDYSVRAREYAKWLDQIYRELKAARENYLKKNSK